MNAPARTICFALSIALMLFAALAANDGQRRRLDVLTCLAFILFFLPFAAQAWVDWYGG